MLGRLFHAAKPAPGVFEGLSFGRNADEGSLDKGIVPVEPESI